MSNDLTTLSGALLEMKDELIYQLGQKGVTASYSSTDGLLGLIADACYCGYGCWIPNGAKSIAKRARLPLTLTRDTLRYLEGEGLAARSHYGEIDDEGYPHCWHGWVMTAKAKERYKERYERAWKAECEYLDKSIRGEA